MACALDTRGVRQAGATPQATAGCPSVRVHGCMCLHSRWVGVRARAHVTQRLHAGLHLDVGLVLHEDLGHLRLGDTVLLPDRRDDRLHRHLKVLLQLVHRLLQRHACLLVLQVDHLAGLPHRATLHVSGEHSGSSEARPLFPYRRPYTWRSLHVGP